MFGRGIEDFFGRILEFLAFFGFRLLRVALGIQFGLGLLCGRTVVSRLLGPLFLGSLFGFDLVFGRFGLENWPPSAAA